ncbi:hypothetical protein Ndes2437A_g04589 [Nannochloris sp. 'desiccata']
MLPILQGGGKPNDSDHDPPSDDTGYNLDTEEHMQDGDLPPASSAWHQCGSKVCKRNSGYWSAQKDRVWPLRVYPKDASPVWIWLPD